MVKPCICCGELKTSIEYSKHKLYKDYLDSRCKECVSAQSKVRRELKKTAPDTPDRCECCGGISNKVFVLDHCHETNKFRGWICESCNHAIGKLGDNIEGVQKALDYLKRTP